MGQNSQLYFHTFSAHLSNKTFVKDFVHFPLLLIILQCLPLLCSPPRPFSTVMRSLRLSTKLQPQKHWPSTAKPQATQATQNRDKSFIDSYKLSGWFCCTCRNKANVFSTRRAFCKPHWPISLTLMPLLSSQRVTFQSNLATQNSILFIASNGVISEIRATQSNSHHFSEKFEKLTVVSMHCAISQCCVFFTIGQFNSVW